MQCAVIGCSNVSNKNSASGEITFHAVPTDVKLKEKWLNIIDTRNRKHEMYVCSLHFNCDDVLASGELRQGAVPEFLQACRICLSVGNKLYDMNISGLNRAYEELTSIMVSQSSSIPFKLCWECAHRVLASSRLRAKALRAHSILMDFVKSHRYLTTDIILDIDRIEHNLTSTLTHNYNIDDLNIIIQESELTLDSKPEVDLDLDRKDEEIVTNDNVDDVNEGVGDTNDERSDVNEEIEANDVVKCDVLEDTDEEWLVSEELFSDTNSVDEFKTKKVKLKNDKGANNIKVVDNNSKNEKQKVNEDIFNIIELSLEEQHQEIEKRKESWNFLNGRFKCMICFKGFGEKDSYNMHMYRHSDKAGTFECDICKIRYKKRHHFRKHRNTHNQKFICTSCPFVTTTTYSARRHKNYHNGTVYSCPHCSEQFGKWSTYLGHVRIQHPSDFVCELCGNSFVSQKGVYMHKKLKHRFDDHSMPVDAPRCDTCDIRFQNQQALEKHRLLSPKHTQHVPSKPRGPRIARSCENTVTKGPISCEQCDEELPNAKLYFYHFKRAHPDKTWKFPRKVVVRDKCICEVCGKMFRCFALLRDHSYIHTSGQQFSCDHCHKRFQTKYRLVLHMKLHQDGVRKTYECPDCGKRLSNKANLHRHAYIHSSLRPFECEICGKTFNLAPTRSLHIAHVHMKKPWPKRNRTERRNTVKRKREASEDEDE